MIPHHIRSGTRLNHFQVKKSPHNNIPEKGKTRLSSSRLLIDGTIRVLLLHADQTYGEASLNKLRLYYDQAKNQYQLMGPEVARIKQVIK